MSAQVQAALIVAALSMSSTNAFADNIPPNTVYVLNADEKSAITAECDAPVVDQMHCHFTQTTVSKPDETKAAERIAKGVGDLLKAPASEFKGCDSYPGIVEALESGKAPAEVADKKGFEENWAKQPPVAKADTLKMMKAFADFCKSHDRTNAEAMARASEDLANSTCKISNWKFDKTFTLNFSTKRWQSTIQTGDSCGTIEYSEFSKPDDPQADSFWNYTAKSIVTNPKGQNIIGETCSATDQSEHHFTWQVGKFYANCRYVEIEP
ncbi:hypothetical protein [Mesorhizobium sp. 113-3-3]|uniref:hypothetical protein n=1 Tax=Mesorhizobium sp. 113-3-3 TaxID=2744516 RepID=UPI00192620CE|nr:hypothetical protein [Mesorhizobium sp. 113-3-3]BCG79913.1 hypothetical protein MesoLj113b_34550 [Mesorhizobium sp. 113-3-3]